MFTHLARGPAGTALTKKIVALVAAAAAAAVLATDALNSQAPEAQAALAPQAQTGLAPTVITANSNAGPEFVVEARTRDDRRSLQSGIAIHEGTLYLWGWGKCGALGYKTTCSAFATPDNIAPTKVTGLPDGSIADVASGIYNYNALDTDGYVWGWGSYSNRDGTGIRTGTGASHPPRKLRIGGAWNNASAPLLGEGDKVVILSSTEMSGAAVTESGYVYSWGGKHYGGVGQGDLSYLIEGNNTSGALRVLGLPSPTDPGNMPIQLEGGYRNYWMLLQNGEVWYFGGDTNDLGEYERPEGDRPKTHTQVTSNGNLQNGVAQTAYRSMTLAPWFKNCPQLVDKAEKGLAKAPFTSDASMICKNSEEPVDPDKPNGAKKGDGFIVQTHSGIWFGAALLSSGKVLTWGRDPTRAALGRQCSGTATEKATCARYPALANLGAYNGRVVQLTCSFTAVATLTDNARLVMWGVPLRSYEGLVDNVHTWSSNCNTDWKASNCYFHNIMVEDPPSWRGTGMPIVVANDAVRLQNGQGFTIWWDGYGKMWGMGWQENGQIGHHGTNYGVPLLFHESKKRRVWFSKPQYENCYYTDQTQGYANWENDDEITFKDKKVATGTGGKVYRCSDLNRKKADDGSWYFPERFTFEQCVENGLCTADASSYTPEPGNECEGLTPGPGCVPDPCPADKESAALRGECAWGGHCYTESGTLRPDRPDWCIGVNPDEEDEGDG